MKERTEVHGFFKQVSAGVSNGVRIKGGGAAPEGRVCLWRKIRFSFLESHRVTRLAAGGTLSGGRYHDVYSRYRGCGKHPDRLFALTSVGACAGKGDSMCRQYLPM